MSDPIVNRKRARERASRILEQASKACGTIPAATRTRLVPTIEAMLVALCVDECLDDRAAGALFGDPTGAVLPPPDPDARRMHLVTDRIIAEIEFMVAAASPLGTSSFRTRVGSALRAIARVEVLEDRDRCPRTCAVTVASPAQDPA